MRKIRSRLIGALVLVAILPAIPLSIMVRSLFERSFESATGEEVSGALEAGLVESREALRTAKDEFRKNLKYKWLAGIEEGVIVQDRGSVRAGRMGGTIVRFLGAGEAEPPARAAATEGPERELFEWAAKRDAERFPLPERVGSFLAALLPAPDGGKVLFARGLPEGMVERAEKITTAMALLEGLRIERKAALRSYIVPFALTYALLILVAVAVGARLARRIARPIEALVMSTRRVAAGDLETRVAVSGQGEMRDLEVSFNRMVERLEAQRRELARLERKAAWREIARSLAHEIKNPLTPIQLVVQEIRDRFGGGDEEYARFLKEAARIVDEEVESLRRLTREFSQFARLPEPKPVPGDLCDVVGEIERLYGADKVHVEKPDGPIEASFDGEELHRAMINLVDNGLAACRSVGRPERVTIGVTPGPVDIRIEVSDEGCGIPPDRIDRIFEPNFTTKREGMGLGLAIVEGIVAAHRGAITVRSEPGRGTTFETHLPLSVRGGG